MPLLTALVLLLSLMPDSLVLCLISCNCRLQPQFTPSPPLFSHRYAFFFFCLDIIHIYLNHPQIYFRFSLSALLDSHLAFHSGDTEENPTELTWSAWCLTVCSSLRLPTLPFPHNSFPYRIFRHLLLAGSSHWHLHLVTVCLCCPQMLYPVLSCLCEKQYWSLVVKYSFPQDSLHKIQVRHGTQGAFKQKL